MTLQGDFSNNMNQIKRFHTNFRLKIRATIEAPIKVADQFNHQVQIARE